jgi:hypothetical protein
MGKRKFEDEGIIPLTPTQQPELRMQRAASLASGFAKLAYLRSLKKLLGEVTGTLSEMAMASVA